MVAIATHHLPTDTVELFHFAKREIDAFNREAGRRRRAGEPAAQPPYTLANGHPIALYLYALDNYDAWQKANPPAPELTSQPESQPDPTALPVGTYLPGNEEFGISAKGA